MLKKATHNTLLSTSQLVGAQLVGNAKKCAMARHIFDLSLDLQQRIAKCSRSIEEFQMQCGIYDADALGEGMFLPSSGCFHQAGEILYDGSKVSNDSIRLCGYKKGNELYLLHHDMCLISDIARADLPTVPTPCVFFQNNGGSLQAHTRVGSTTKSTIIGRVVSEPFSVSVRGAACKALTWTLDISRGMCVINLKKLATHSVKKSAATNSDVDGPAAYLPANEFTSKLILDLCEILHRQKLEIRSLQMSEAQHYHLAVMPTSVT
jgi:hypothetical protein